MSSNQIIVFTVVLVAAVVVWALYSHSSKSVTSIKGDTTIEDYFTPGVDHDTIYFRVVDEYGQISYLHDSGVKPGAVARDNGKFDLDIVKKEYNEGKVQEIGIPRVIKYGQQITDLKHTYQIPSDQVKDKGLYYVVTVNTDGIRFTSS